MTERYYDKGIAPKLTLGCPHCRAGARFESLYGDLPLPVMLADGKNGTKLSWAGRLSCLVCGLNRTHEVDWPREAFYQVAYRGEILWAFDRAMMVDTLAYLTAGADRDAVRRNSPYATRLLRLPKTFLAAKARETLAAKIEALLARG
ncbi:hypothetical protein [uncultured Maricaulis sp.]|uniref:hypothetical protein n=1 Tax=uncultured Maricaulis sp. TaxID=174710 RepID=UPI0030DA4926|tara:strand:- start:997 stop:1437 length:441 start_codon:yes stop_codon:yes gene_type:complete